MLQKDEKEKYYKTVLWLKSYKDKYYRHIYVDGQLQKIKSPQFKESDSSYPPKTLNDLIDEKSILEKEMEEIKKAINGIDDPKHRYVLSYKFLYFYSLEEVSELMHYSLTTIKTIYKEAISLYLIDLN